MSSYEFESHEPVDLYVEIGKGSVTVNTSDTTATTVDVQGREADQVMVRQDGNQVSVIAPQTRSGLFGSEPSYAVTVTLPESSNATIKTGSADITLDGAFGYGQIKSGSGDCRLATFAGPLTVETGSGDIDVQHAGADLRVKSGSGDVDINQTDATAVVSTGSGDVKIGTTNGPSVIKTGSGDLEIGRALEGVSMSTGSGDMRIHTATKGKFSAKGASGDVQIGIPAGVPVWTDLTTVSGEIHSNLRGAGQPEPGSDYIELRAKTVSGDIQLVEV
jgi:DUF4097 and DUF4098 domain-containing protein YvlB